MIAIHGNRLLLYLVFKALGANVLDADNAEAEMLKIPMVAKKCLEDLTAEILQNYPSSYAGNLFKNITKCQAIASAIV